MIGRLDASAVGLDLPAAELEITRRNSMAYAAAIRPRPLYLDDLAPDGPLVPPFFCVVPEWSILNGSAYCNALGLDETTRRRGVHVLQDSRFLRSIRAPARLQTRGRITAMRPTRRGALVSVHLVTSDSIGPVAETDWSAIYLDLDCEEAGTAEVPETPGPPAIETETTIHVGPGVPHVYSECSGIWNPIHTERAVATSIGLSDIITHGTALWALAGEALIDSHCAGHPSRLRRLSCRFKSPVYPGTDMTVSSGPTTTGLGFHVRTGDLPVLTGGILETA